MSAAPHVAPRLPSRHPLGHALALRRDVLTVLLRAQREVGGFARLRVALSDVVVIASPALACEVLSEKAASFQKSRGLREFGKPVAGTGLLVSEPPLHRARRGIVAPAFSPARLAAFDTPIVAACDRALEGLLAAGEVELAASMAELTLEIVAQTLVRTDLRSDVRTIGEAFAAASEAVVSLARAPIPLPAFVPSRARRVVQASADALDSVVYRILRERRASADDPGDVLSRLLAARDPATGAALDDTALRDELVTLVLAGHETTALALTWALALLALHPEHAARLHAEVDAVLGERAPTSADLAQLPFCAAVVEETLRLYPPAYMITRLAREDVVIGTERVKEGELLLVSVYGLHRLPEHFPEPERFRPERFLDGAARALPRGAYLPFGLGPRVCVGAHFATMEAVLVLARIAQRVELAGAVDSLPGLAPKVTLRPAGPIVWRVRSRHPVARTAHGARPERA